MCAPNANLPNRTVVLADITLGQLIDYFKENYPTVRQQYQQALFGITVQGSDSVGSYYTKLKKIARHANMGDDEFRRRFLGDFLQIIKWKFAVWGLVDLLMKSFHL